MACSEGFTDKVHGNTQTCCPCEFRLITKNAVKWCQECDETLCHECSEYHSTEKLLRGHNILPINTCLKLPSFVRRIHICPSHNEKLDLFCETHQKPCCTDCVRSNHSACTGVTLLNNVVKGMRESESFYNMKENIREQKSLVQSIIQNRKENERRLQQQRNLITDEVRGFRQKINNKLDELETKFLSEIDDTIDNEIDNLSVADNELSIQFNKLDEVHRNILDTSKYCNEVQTYLGLRHIRDTEETLTGCKQKLSFLLEKKSLKEINVRIKISSILEHIVAKLSSFGSVKTSIDDIDIDFTVIQLEKIELQLIRSINPKLDDCIILSALILEDKIVLLDYGYSRLCIFMVSGDPYKTVKLEGTTNGMVLIKRETLFVSYSNKQSFGVYDTNNFTKQTEIKSGHNHYGLSFYEKSHCLVTAIRGAGVSVTNLSGKVLKIFFAKDSMLTYVHCTGDKIMYTDFQSHTLFCIGIDGEEHWNCKFEDMKGPRNICTDQFGNIFVAATDSNKVVLISPNGRTCKVLLKKDDGMCEPKAIYFDKTKSHLLVANTAGKSFLYKVNYK